MQLTLLFVTGASRTSTDFCRLSPTPLVHLKSSKCVYVRRACFDAEQIILHGRDAADNKQAIDSVLNGMKDPYSTFAMLRPWSRNITLVAQPGATYRYLPMAINARAAAAWQKRGDASMVQHRQQPVEASGFSNRTAVAFFTTWSTSFAETFARAATQAFEQYCRLSSSTNIDLIPATWGDTKDGKSSDSAATFLGPLSKTRVEAMSLTPHPNVLAEHIHGMLTPRFSPGQAICNANGSRASGRQTCLSLYLEASDATAYRHRWLNALCGCVRDQASACSITERASHLSSIPTQASERYFAERGQRCYRRAQVCDFSFFPVSRSGDMLSMRPWSLMQLLAAHHAGPAPASLSPHMHMLSCKRVGRRQLGHGDIQRRGSSIGIPAHGQPCLRVVYIRRLGRRRLRNIAEHVAACNEWRSRLPNTPRTICVAHSFDEGLKANLPLLRRTDVLIGPHGADMTNAFALHAGASVVELLPPIRNGCPCTMYQRMFAAEPQVFHYTASTTNKSHASRTGPANIHGTYSSDFIVPVSVTERILEHVVTVGGRPENFRTADFRFA